MLLLKPAPGQASELVTPTHRDTKVNCQTCKLELGVDMRKKWRHSYCRHCDDFFPEQAFYQKHDMCNTAKEADGLTRCQRMRRKRKRERKFDQTQNKRGRFRSPKCYTKQVVDRSLSISPNATTLGDAGTTRRPRPVDVLAKYAPRPVEVVAAAGEDAIAALTRTLQQEAADVLACFAADY